jgi:antitoxin (DNA-binding transcriptional repressor) of toxin-antitoxin stability system
MKAFTTDELRGKASELRKVISREPQALLTAGGEPIALLVPVNSATLEETADAIQQARARLALKSIRQRSGKTSRDRMTITQIDRVVAATRKAKRRRDPLPEKRRS